MDPWLRPKWFSCLLVFFIVAWGICCSQEKISPQGRGMSVEVSVGRLRANPGEKVRVWAAVRSDETLRQAKVKSRLFIPTRGAEDLSLGKVEPAAKDYVLFQGDVDLHRDSPDGIYGVTVEVSSGAQRSVGKASFFVGKTVGDFLIVSAVPEESQDEDLRRYFEDFRSVGGNMVIIHNIISGKAWYPSRVSAKAAQAGTPEDKVGKTLKLAEEMGFSSFLSVSWDMTRSMPYSEYMPSMDAVIAELWELYGANPALLGFYDYQEGSGTYLVSHLREFAATVKAQNSGVLTACAPYIDDPLLAGYLAAIDDLDVVIYQGAVMASYRPDNRKCFPLRRTKDCTSLSAGATIQRGKVTLSHVELFGYLEKSYAGAYIAGPDDIRSQILSAATAFGPEGITLFSYHYNIHEMGKKIPEVKESRRGVEEGMRAYDLIAKSAASRSSRLGLYIPYSDWWVNRWADCLVPALDALRRLGVNPDIIPFIPPAGEDVLPYYPYHLNQEQLDYLLRHQYVLVLADIAGMQDTDSLLIKDFVEKGGVVLIFGPRIPYGDLFDREDLCGGRENPAASHSLIKAQTSLGMRTKKGDEIKFSPKNFSSLRPVKGTAWATFEDGQAAVLGKKSGAGLVLSTPLSLSDAVKIMPTYLRDLLDTALGSRGIWRAFDVLGADEDVDLAMAVAENGYQLALVNYKKTPVSLIIRPLRLKEEEEYRLTDLKTGRILRSRRGKDFGEVSLTLPALDYILVALSEK